MQKNLLAALQRSRSLTAVLLVGTFSIACSNSGNNFDFDEEADQTYNVTVDRIVATGNNTNASVATPALPVTGRNIVLDLEFSK